MKLRRWRVRFYQHKVERWSGTYKATNIFLLDKKLRRLVSQFSGGADDVHDRGDDLRVNVG